MKSIGEPPLRRQIASDLLVWLIASFTGAGVCSVAIFVQWLIYDDWLRDKGPVRIVGSALAGLITCLFVAHRQFANRERKLQLLQRFETIRWMNDRIRNALQAIECVTYAANPEATQSVRAAVDTIEGVLQEVLADPHSAPVAASKNQSSSAELQPR